MSLPPSEPFSAPSFAADSGASINSSAEKGPSIPGEAENVTSINGAADGVASDYTAPADVPMPAATTAQPIAEDPMPPPQPDASTNQVEIAQMESMSEDAPYDEVPGVPLNPTLPAPTAVQEQQPVAPVMEQQQQEQQQQQQPIAPASTAEAVPEQTAIVPPPTAEPISNAGAHPSHLVAETSVRETKPTPNTAPAARDAGSNGALEITAAQLKFAQSTLKSLRSRREAIAFLRPVDAVALGIPQYHDIVKQPMDFGTIDVKLALTGLALRPGSKASDKAKQAPEFGLGPGDAYKRMADFEADVRQVFDNCALFNGPQSPYTENARVLEAALNKYMKDAPTAEAERDAESPRNGAEVGGEARVRRASNSLPTIRRSESDGRPKREIHPPPPKDLPYVEDGRKRKKGVADSLRFCGRVIDELLKPSNEAIAWVFYEVPSLDFDWAPAYYDVIKKPMSLKQVQRNLRAGKYVDAAAFDADVRLVVSNCFAFNAPGSDVYVMGEKLLALYETQMARKPVEYAESSDEEDEEEAARQDEISARLSAQIADLTRTLALLEADGKSVELVASTKAMLASLEASVVPRKKKSKAKAAKVAKTAKVERKPSKPAKVERKPERKENNGPKKMGKESDVRVVTYEQKEELAAQITELSEERLEGAIGIIGGAGDGEEIELDIDELDPATLYRLYKYVVRVPKAASRAGDGRSRGTGGVRRKNLDEGEEAARIAGLEAQLDAFRSESDDDDEDD